MSPFLVLLVGIVVVLGGILVLRLPAFLALILASLIVGGLTPSEWIERSAGPEAAGQNVGERVAAGFGKTCADIGILIAMASIIGKCMLDSGAADCIIRATLRTLGERRAAPAFTFSGFLLGIPVFFDTVFYLMIPLGKAMRMRTGHNYLLYVLSIVAGATMAHSLVPPTPGPLLVASKLEIDLGLMIIAGCVVGLFTSSCGLLYAAWINRRLDIPLRDTEDVSVAELEGLTSLEDSQLPPLSVSLLPILLPVVLVGGNTVLSKLISNAHLLSLVGVFGNKNIALVISAAIALAILVWQKRPDKDSLSKALQSALSGAGTIILITAAGGAFGKVLQQTGIGEEINRLSQQYQVAVIPLAFFVTMLIRTAQGSATVAMITAVGILAGLASSPGLGFHPVYIALAIGCGSKPIAWMNDSGFWIVCKMSGMTESETLKTHTIMTSLMAVAGLAVTMIGAWALPLL